MNKVISVLGCGWLGYPLAIKLIQKHFSVNGSTTSIDKLDKLENSGINPFVVHLNQVESNINNFLNADILIVNVPSKNIDNFRQLIGHIEASKIKKVLFISSTSVYSLSNEVVTEKSTTNNSSLSKIELLFKSNQAFATTVLRLAGLYGYDRIPANFIKNGVKIKNPEGIINLIHRDDCIRIIEKLISKNMWGETLNACSDFHPKRKEFYSNQLQLAGRDVPDFDESTPSLFKIVSSKKLITLLEYQFKHTEI